jgi:phosphatidylserine/phosphatidylglycerophosphate/cardiolipin synthase-like enzyme
VLAGSANFSVRGLYVQANNVLLFREPSVASLYGEVFDAIWSDPHTFSNSELAARWLDVAAEGLPTISFAFSPHHDSAISRKRRSARCGQSVDPDRATLFLGRDPARRLTASTDG